MPPPAPDKQRYASANRPVNQRTARPEHRPSTPLGVHPSVAQRLARRRAQQQLGSPLSQSLAPRPPSLRTPKTLIGLALGGTLAGVGLLIAVLQGSPLLGGVSALAGLAVGGLAWARHRRQARRWGMGAGNGAGLPLQSTMPFDAQAIQTLDEVLLQLAPVVSLETLAQLGALKQTLVRIAPLLARSTVNEVFTQDDRFYITELVRRYLPDSLQAYLQVPAGQRDLVLDSGASAENMLNGQLRLLWSELSRLEALLVQVTSESLQQQGRFLQAKHREG